jgi:hypothetical protein
LQFEEMTDQGPKGLTPEQFQIPAVVPVPDPLGAVKICETLVVLGTLRRQHLEQANSLKVETSKIQGMFVSQGVLD